LDFFSRSHNAGRGDISREKTPAGSVATLAHEDPGLEVSRVGGRISTVDMGNQEVMEGAKVEGQKL